MSQDRLSNIYSIFAFTENSLKKFSRPFIAYGYYKEYRINLQTGEKEDFTLLQLDNRLHEIQFQKNYQCPYVFHLFYELGFYFLGMDDLIVPEQLLALEILYSQVEPFELSDRKISTTLMEAPLFDDYKKAFDEGYQHLLAGNCYQFNLTFPYRFQAEDVDLPVLISSLWKKKTIPAYAHASQIPFLERCFVSNSPECLFQAKQKNSGTLLWTMPIKGTTSFNDGDCYQKVWNQLSKCHKNGAELDMITDLLRNDLSKIEKPVAKVIKRRASLIVPSIMHQYSLIEVDLGLDVTLGTVLRAIFPGGSITGAPKKRVMEILKELEKNPRGFYCGSTILFYKRIRAASINIRSLLVNTKLKEIVYQAGGGITLQSCCQDEFEEMNLKVKSSLGRY